MSEWENGRMGEWENGRMGECLNDKMDKYNLTLPKIYIKRKNGKYESDC